MLALQGEKQNVFDARLIRQQHHEPIDADSDARRGRHPVLESAHEVPIGFGNLFVARRALSDLTFEARTLIVGIVEFGERVADFSVGDEEFVTCLLYTSRCV